MRYIKSAYYLGPLKITIQPWFKKKKKVVGILKLSPS